MTLVTDTCKLHWYLSNKQMEEASDDLLLVEVSGS